MPPTPRELPTAVVNSVSEKLNRPTNTGSPRTGLCTRNRKEHQHRRTFNSKGMHSRPATSCVADGNAGATASTMPRNISTMPRNISTMPRNISTMPRNMLSMFRVVCVGVGLARECVCVLGCVTLENSLPIFDNNTGTRTGIISAVQLFSPLLLREKFANFCSRSRDYGPKQKFPNFPRNFSLS